MSITLPEAPTTKTAPQPEDVQVLIDHLDALGDADLIAEAFADEDILGTPCNSGMCAVAIYLQRHSGLDDINVGVGMAMRWMPAGSDDLVWKLGDAVCEFIGRFDSGSYPHLLWPEDRALWAGDV